MTSILNATAYGTFENKNYMIITVPCGSITVVRRPDHLTLIPDCYGLNPLRPNREKIRYEIEIAGSCDWEYVYLGPECHLYFQIWADNGIFCFFFHLETAFFSQVQRYQYTSAKRWYLEAHMPSIDEKYVSKTRDISVEDYIRQKPTTIQWTRPLIEE